MTPVGEGPRASGRHFLAAHLWLVLMVTLIAVAAAVAYARSGPTTYSSTSSVLVGPQVFANGASEAADMATERAVATSAVVVGPAAKAIGESTAGLASALSTRIPVDTHILVIGATGSSPEQAQARAHAVAVTYTSYRNRPAVSPRTGAAAGQVTPPSQDVRVITPATLPASPDRPNVVLIVAVALVLGASLGVGIAVLVDSSSDRVRAAADLEAAGSLPVLAQVRAVAPDGPIAVLRHEQSRAADQYRRLTIATLTAARGRSTPVVLVTSGLRHEGVTTTAANVAAAAAETGIATALVLTETGGPAARLKAGGGRPGRESAADEGAEPHPAEVSVHDLSGGDRSPLHRGNDVVRLISSMPGDTLVVVAAPAMLTEAGAAAVAGRADAILVVARAHLTTRTEVRQVLDQLKPVRDRLLGSVLVTGRRPLARALSQLSQRAPATRSRDDEEVDVDPEHRESSLA